MLIPIVKRQTEQFLREVPMALREGGRALGGSKWKIATVVVPAGSTVVLTGMILGSPHRRQIGAASVHCSQQPVLGGIRELTASLPLMIYFRAISPFGDWHRQAWAAGLVLITIVLIFNVSARLVLARAISIPRG